VIGAAGSFSTAVAGPVMGWINETYGSDRVLPLWSLLPFVVGALFTVLYFLDKTRGAYRPATL